MTQQLALAIDWPVVESRWAALLERHETERADFIRDLAERGASQQEIADHLGLERRRIGQLLDYGAVVEKLGTVVPNFQEDPAIIAIPTERELRPYIQQAATEVAAERGIERVREGRTEVYERAADTYSRREEPRPHVANNSGNNEWYTPAEYIEAARLTMGDIDLDPASSDQANTVVKAASYFTAEINGLDHEWRGRVWMNPPYAADLIGLFSAKLIAHVESGDIEAAVVLVNNATETAWFSDMARKAAAVCFPSRRVRFWQPSGEVGAPLQGQAILYFGTEINRFIRSHKALGWIALVSQ